MADMAGKYKAFRIRPLPIFDNLVQLMLVPDWRFPGVTPACAAMLRVELEKKGFKKREMKWVNQQTCTLWQGIGLRNGFAVN